MAGTFANTQWHPATREEKVQKTQGLHFSGEIREAGGHHQEAELEEEKTNAKEPV